MRYTPALLLPLLLGAGCNPALRQQVDYGNCYRYAFEQQADLSRPLSVDDAYPLSGKEGLLLRALLDEATGDEEQDKTVK
ncbi:MAG: hypothetical protein ABIO70_04235 [Pseudomonadota bacterium]